MSPKIFGLMVLVGTIIFGWFWLQELKESQKSESFDWGMAIAFTLFPYAALVGIPAAAITWLIGLIRQRRA